MIEHLPTQIDDANDYLCHDAVTRDDVRYVVRTRPGPGMDKHYLEGRDDFYLVEVLRDDEPMALLKVPGHPMGAFENYMTDEAIDAHVAATYALERGEDLSRAQGVTQRHAFGLL